MYALYMCATGAGTFQKETLDAIFFFERNAERILETIGTLDNFLFVGAAHINTVSQ